MRSKTQRVPPSSDAARDRMRAVRQRDTAPELALRSALHRLGLRFRVQIRPIPGVRRSADVVFPKLQLAVFIDGCFWHSCPQHGTTAKANATFWKEKLDANRLRDRGTDHTLRAAGWQVVRVWEHENALEAASRILNVVRALTPRQSTSPKRPSRRDPRGST